MLHNGEMLGESRLMMDEEALRQGAAPIRNATVVASGHVVLLAMSTEMARRCFKGDVLVQLRGLGQKRQDMRQTVSPDWLAADNSGGNGDSLEEDNPVQVCCSHLYSSFIFRNFPLYKPET